MDWNGGIDYGLDYGILCQADGTVSKCSNFLCPFPDLKRVSFNTGRVASYIQKAFVEAY